MPSDLDPHVAAYWALIAVSLVALGAVLTGSVDTFSLEARGSVMAAIVGVLGYVAWRSKRRP